MYQVIIKGRNLEELKKAVLDISNELTSGIVSGAEIQKDLTVVKEEAEVFDEVKIPTEKDVKETIAAMTPEVVDRNDKEPISSILAREEEGLDAEGLPWDKRIHSASKNKDKGGTWRKKRGLDVEEFNAIKKELHAAVKLAANPPVIPPAPVTVSPGQHEVVDGYVVNNPVPKAPEAPVIPREVEIPPVIEPTPIPQPMSSGGHTIDTFITNFDMVIAELINTKVLTQEYIETLKEYFKVTEIWQVNDEQKAEMFTNFVTANIIQKV